MTKAATLPEQQPAWNTDTLGRDAFLPIFAYRMLGTAGFLVWSFGLVLFYKGLLVNLVRFWGPALVSHDGFLKEVVTPFDKVWKAGRKDFGRRDVTSFSLCPSVNSGRNVQTMTKAGGQST